MKGTTSPKKESSDIPNAPIRIVDLAKAKCKASSTLSYKHRCDTAFDGTPNTEFASKREGVGLWIEVMFPRKLFLAQVDLLNRMRWGKFF